MGGRWEGGKGLGLWGMCWGASLVCGVGREGWLALVLMEPCVTVWAGEEGAQLEEEEVEEEEESGNLDEEELKKMQSDEVCGQSPEALLPAQPPGRGVGPHPWALYLRPLFQSSLSYTGHSRPRGDSL